MNLFFALTSSIKVAIAIIIASRYHREIKDPADKKKHGPGAVLADRFDVIYSQ